jgi:hypothetical protein
LKVRSLMRHHPWVFAGSVARGGGDVRAGGEDGRMLYEQVAKVAQESWK